MKTVVLPQTVATVAIDPLGAVYGMNMAAEKLLGENAGEFMERAADTAFEAGKVMTVNNRALQMDMLKTDHGRFVMLFDAAPPDDLRNREINALRRDLQKERRLAKANTHLSAAIAHEFGTPISAIRLKTVILKRHLPRLSAEQIEQYVEQIDAQLNRMSDLLDDLLLVNQLQSAQESRTLLRLNLETFCRELVDDIAFRWEGRDIVLTVIGQTDPAEADLRLLRYALSNLIDNALKFSPDGGSVEVEVRADDDEIALIVGDHGIGIPAAELEAIFSPFYHASNAGDHSGAGIGLAIMKTSVEAAGGSISVESTLGEGSRFTVSLPLRPA